MEYLTLASPAWPLLSDFHDWSRRAGASCTSDFTSDVKSKFIGDFFSCNPYLVYFAKEVNPSLAELPSNVNGGLAKLGLTSLLVGRDKKNIICEIVPWTDHTAD